MSVPPDRMAVRPAGDPNKIMGLDKKVFWVIIALGLLLAFYIWRRSKNTSSSALTSANAGAEPDTTNGVTAADIGGTPADNSFATNTDLSAIEQQIQQLQDSLFQLQQSNGGNGAGITDPSKGGSPGGVTGGVNPSPTEGGIMTPGGSLTTSPITFPLNTPGSGPPIDTSTSTPIGTPGGRPIDVPVMPGSGGIMTPQTNAAFQGNLNLVAQGLTPSPSGGHAVFY